jgi:hypothetical protein
LRDLGSKHLLLRRYIVEYEIQSDLLDFLIQNSIVISSVENWDDYSQTTAVSGESKLTDSLMPPREPVWARLLLLAISNSCIPGT